MDPSMIIDEYNYFVSLAKELRVDTDIVRKM